MVGLMFVMILIIPFLVFGQPTGGGPPSPMQPVPITGIEILVGAGALLGAKRMLANRKSNS